MLKKELIEVVASKTGLTKKDATAALEAMLDAVRGALSKGDYVLLTGFGKFEVRKRASRPGINPKTLAKITLPAAKVPAFKAGKTLKSAVR